MDKTELERISSMRHNRYLPYLMLDRTVIMREESESTKLEVKDVVRNVFEGTIEITDRTGLVTSVPEPRRIVKRSGDILFVYGNMKQDISDEELFDIMRDGGGSEYYGETIHHILKRTDKDIVKIIHFSLENV